MQNQRDSEMNERQKVEKEQRSKASEAERVKLEEKILKAKETVELADEEKKTGVRTSTTEVCVSLMGFCCK